MYPVASQMGIYLRNIAFQSRFMSTTSQPRLGASLRASTSLPVLFVSVRGDLEARLAAVRCGAAAYLTKPVDVGALVNLATVFFRRGQYELVTTVLNRAKEMAQPKDIADIFVAVPFTIRVLPVEKK